MAILTTGVVNLIVILVIGIIVGLVFNRYGRSWLGRQTVGATGVDDVTYALVEIAARHRIPHHCYSGCFRRH